MKRSSYTEIGATSGSVFIVDDCRPDCPSVTNDAERVVTECLAKYGERRIIYRDSDGQWGELLHTGIQFRGFGPYDGPLPDWERAA